MFSLGTNQPCRESALFCRKSPTTRSANQSRELTPRVLLRKIGIRSTSRKMTPGRTTISRPATNGHFDASTSQGHRARSRSSAHSLLPVSNRRLSVVTVARRPDLALTPRRAVLSPPHPHTPQGSSSPVAMNLAAVKTRTAFRLPATLEVYSIFSHFSSFASTGTPLFFNNLIASLNGPSS